jgi:hypothetical protein
MISVQEVFNRLTKIFSMEIIINLCIQVLNEIYAHFFSFLGVYRTDVSSCNLGNFKFNYNLMRGYSSVPT